MTIEYTYKEPEDRPIESGIITTNDERRTRWILYAPDFDPWGRVGLDLMIRRAADNKLLFVDRVDKESAEEISKVFATMAKQLKD